MEKLGSISMSEHFLANSGIGCWAYEKDPQGPPRLYVDETMLHLMGQDDMLLPEETYQLWVNNIASEDMKTVENAFAIMESGRFSTFQYPWSLPNGDIIYVQSSGTRNSEYTKGIRLEGVHREITDMVHRQLYESQKGERTNRILHILTQDYLVAFAVNLDTDEAKTISMNEDGERYIRATGVNITEYKTYSARIRLIAEKMMHPEDRETFLNALLSDKLKTQSEIGRIFTMELRGILSGEVRHVQVRVVPNPDEDLHSVIFGVRDIEREYRERKKAEQNEAIYQMAILSSAYGYFKVNLTTNRIVTATVERVAGTLSGYSKKLGGRSLSYSKIVDAFAELAVDTDYQENFRNNLSVEHLKESFQHGYTMPEYICRVYSSEEGLHYRKFVNYLYQDDTNGDICSMVVVYNVTNEMEARERSNRVVDQIMKLSDNFDAIYDIDAATGSYTVVTRGNEYAEKINVKCINTNSYFEDTRVNIENVVYEEDREEVRKNITREGYRKRLEKENSFSYDLRLMNGTTPVWYRVRVTKVPGPKGSEHYLQGVFSIDREISERLERQEELERALVMAQAANRAKTTFLNNMSHDIRTPMHAIIGFTDLADSHLEKVEQARGYLSKIRQSSEHLMALINDVLDMSRIEAGKLPFNEKEESIPELLHTLKSIVMAEVNAKNQVFSIDTADMENERVICDKLRINQVLLNIVSNSIKYTDIGGRITLRVAQKKSKKEGFGRYEFRIKDNGVGMSSEFQKTVFEPFTREVSSTRSGIVGTGLGMTITKKIVDLCGGTISVLSEKGIGTEFVVNFDFKTAEMPSPSDFSDERFASMRITVVEDGKIGSAGVPQMLEKIGIRNANCCCSEGKSIEETLEKADKESEVIFIDLQLTNRQQLETAKILRTNLGDGPTIYMLTASDWMEEEEEARKLGACAFLEKPFFPSDLKRALLRSADNNEGKFEKRRVQSYIGSKILVVEDNELNREIIDETLKSIGIRAEIVTDGIYAVEKIRDAEPDTYDIILMDVQMPIMDGYEATRRIRQINDVGKNIPIIAMTANAFEEDRVQALEAGMNEHIAKPLQKERLYAVLDRFIG